jgi:branched-chain amino acid transport system substrate-binding protein
MRIAEFIKQRYPNRTVGCLFKQNDYGVNIANTFFKLFNDKIYSQAYQEGQNDFRSLLSKFKSSNVNLIFLPGNYEETAQILKQAKEIKYDALFIGTDGAYSPKLIELAHGAAENFLLSMMPVDYSSPAYLEFERAYLDTHHTKPDIFSCYGYESGLIMIEALKNTGPNPTSQKVKAYLRSTSFNSLTGALRFDIKGEPNRDYKIYTVHNNEFQPYSYSGLESQTK